MLNKKNSILISGLIAALGFLFSFSSFASNECYIEFRAKDVSLTHPKIVGEWHPVKALLPEKLDFKLIAHAGMPGGACNIRCDSQKLYEQFTVCDLLIAHIGKPGSPIYQKMTTCNYSFDSRYGQWVIQWPFLDELGRAPHTYPVECLGSTRLHKK